MTLTKAELAAQLVDQLGRNRPDAKRLVDQFFEAIKSALVKGEAVKISGFGHFELRDKHERPGRNPKTGEEFTITARRVVIFKAGPTLKGRVECLPMAEELA